MIRGQHRAYFLCFEVRRVLLVRAFNMVEKAVLEQLYDLQRTVHVVAVSETLSEESGVLDQMVMFALVNLRARVSGFSKEQLFMGKVGADMLHQAVHYGIKDLPGMTVNHSVVQLAEQNQKFFMIVVEQLYVHAHTARPSDQRQLCGLISVRETLGRLKARGEHKCLLRSQIVEVVGVTVAFRLPGWVEPLSCNFTANSEGTV
jgi:hypothetical protein